MHLTEIFCRLPASFLTVSRVVLIKIEDKYIEYLSHTWQCAKCFRCDISHNLITARRMLFSLLLSDEMCHFFFISSPGVPELLAYSHDIEIIMLSEKWEDLVIAMILTYCVTLSRDLLSTWFSNLIWKMRAWVVWKMMCWIQLLS